MSARFTLHGIWLSGPTYKVGLMLALAGEAFDYVHVDLLQGEHKALPFAARQRYGQVPLLVDNAAGRHLCQSAAILEYLADTLGRLGGATLDERLHAREWLYWDFDRLAPAIYRTRGIRRGFRKASDEVLDMYQGEAKAALAVLDGHLAGRSWTVGEGPTIADVDLYGTVAYAAEGGNDLEPYANVRAWLSRMETLPGFRGTGDLLPRETRAAA